jgi:alkaline phosphatase D
MNKITRRRFIALAASFGATLAWRGPRGFASTIDWHERREFFPQGVASADPHPDSVIVWTRRTPTVESAAKRLTVEIAADPTFRKVFARSEVPLSADTDWTCRFLVANLKPRTVYWYRFTDEH